MKIRPSLVFAGVTALLLSGGVAQANPPGQGAAAGAGALTAAERENAAIITLITGDRVLVSPSGNFAFEPGEGRDGVGYVTRTQRTGEQVDRYLIPRDALSLLAGGVLDDRLFNVSMLARDDDYRDGEALPLIVQNGGGSVSAASLDGVTVTEDLESIDAQAVSVPAAEAGEFWSDLAPGAGARSLDSGFTRVWLDGKVQALLDESVPQVGAPAVWETGNTGEGVTTAVLDTGYDPTHPDLEGRVTAAKDFTNTSPDAIDGHGHGTHVASTVAGTGGASGGRYTGVAPGSSLIIGKVLDDEGGGFDSDIIAGMEWAAAQGATAVNMSLGGGPTDGTDPMDLAVNEITESTGTLFVIAAGNFGCAECVSSPGAADAALTVGSVTKSDELSDFSSQGPRLGDFAVKPDITAPGTDITAAKAAGTQMGDPAGDFHTTASGTSMATPHVTGAVALLKQAHPEWKAEQLKAALMGSGKGLDGLSVYQQGAGRLDVFAAVSAAVSPSVGSLSFGNFAYPHDQPAESKTVTYTNTSDADVTLDVAVTGGNPGLFTVDTTTITVPAHGTTDVTVTVHPSADDTLGAQSAVLTATNTTTSIRTAVGANLEEQMFDLKVDTKARSGSSVDEIWAMWVDLDTGESDLLYELDENGDAVVRLPEGRYEVIGFLRNLSSKPWTTSFANDVALSADSTVKWDASKGKEQKADLDPAGAKRLGGEDDLLVGLGDDWDQGIGVGYDGATKVYTVESKKLKAGTFIYLHAPVYASPSGTKKPYEYNLLYPSTGKVPAGKTHVTKNKDLAKEEQVFESQGVKTTAVYGSFNVDYFTFPVYRDVPVPGTLTSYYMPGTWASEVFFGNFDEEDVEVATGAGVKAKGANPTVAWNRAPLNMTPTAWRYGDEMYLWSTMFDDANPGIIQDSYFHSGVTGTSSLSINGEQVLSNDTPCDLYTESLPAGAAGTFVFECTAQRDVPHSTIGTSASAQWTFASAPGPDGELVLPGLNAVLLSSPDVVNGFASAKRRQSVELDVFRQEGAEDPGTKRLVFEVSYDDGKTWKKVVVHRTGDHATASLRHPTDAAYVSVRLSATDNAGNQVVQTTIRAYGLN